MFLSRVYGHCQGAGGAQRDYGTLLKARLQVQNKAETQPIGPIVGVSKTLDQAQATLNFILSVYKEV